jgi:hypothetical protein
MSAYTVTKVRKERSADGSHRHIEGVISTAGVHYTRREVVASIDQGNTWQTSSGRTTATIHELNYCPKSGCLATPYIATKRDGSLADNLENLPEG